MKKTNACDDKKSNQLTLKQHENLQKSTKSSAEQMPNSLNDTRVQVANCLEKCVQVANWSKASLEKFEVGLSEMKRIIDANQKRQKASTKKTIQAEDLQVWESLVVSYKLLGMNIHDQQEEYAKSLKIINEESVTVVQEIQKASATMIEMIKMIEAHLLQEQNERIIATPIKALLPNTSKNTKSYQQKVTLDKKLADKITSIQEQSENDIKNIKKTAADAKKMIKEYYTKKLQIIEEERTLITQEIKLMEELAADTKKLRPDLQWDKFDARLKDANSKKTVTKIYKEIELWNGQKDQPQEESKEPPKTAIGYNASNAKVSSPNQLQQDSKCYNSINKLKDSQHNLVATTQKASSQLDDYQSFLEAEQQVSDPIDPQDNIKTIGNLEDFINNNDVLN